MHGLVLDDQPVITWTPHAAQAFDAGSGEPKRCVEMAGWPRMARLIGPFGATVSRALLESFYATPSTEGLSVIFNRSAPSLLTGGDLRQDIDSCQLLLTCEEEDVFS